MGEVIKLPRRNPPDKGHVIIEHPWEFRQAHWPSMHFVQMRRKRADLWEEELGSGVVQTAPAAAQLPPHSVLSGGRGYTIRAMYALRGNEEKMRDAYYLAGLLDCLINQVNPILRTDILRDLYRKVFDLKESLQIHWYGPLDQVLLPVAADLHDEAAYRASLGGAATMKELYRRIRVGTDALFTILSREYVFYCPH